MRSYFISSTFSDMNFERDWFQKNVLPRFREAAHSHGEESDAIDLRIGIDTRELETPERLKQVLGVCSKLISKCKPFMIVFIGDRYGYTADANVITVEFAEELNAEMHTQVLNKSITDLEIDFGIFQQRSSKCIICMRTLRGEFSTEDHKKFFEQKPDNVDKLKKLKERLKREHSNKIIEYTADWDGTKLRNFLTNDGRNLAEVLLERMKADCQEGKDSWLEYEKLSWQEQEEKAAWQFAEVRAENFCAREDTVAKLENIFYGGDKIIFLKGAKGTGKTSLLSKIAVDFKEFGSKVRCIFSGTSTHSSNSLDILRQMVFYAEEVAGKDHFEINTENLYAAYKQRLAEICKQIEEPLFFIIDAVDQIDIDSHREHLDFLIKADNVHCLVSGADFDFSKAQRVLGGRVEPLEFLKDDEVEKVLCGILERNGRDLFDEIAAVVNRSKGKNSPLFLEFVAQIFFLLTAREFNNLDYNEVIQVAVRHVDNMSSKKISDAAVYILKEATNIIFEKPEKAIAAVRLLAISPHGLRRSDLESILKLNTLDYARLIWYLHTFFFERQSGAIDFNHSLIRDGILNDIDKNYIDDGERKITAHIKKNLTTQDWLRCLDGATFAQKTLDYEFLATLYGEAFMNKNSLLIYGITQALRSDGGTICKDLLKKHWDELAIELCAKCYAFFISTLSYMLKSSVSDYEIAKSILISLPAISKEVHKEYLILLSYSKSKKTLKFLAEAEISKFQLQLEHYTKETILAKRAWLSREFTEVISRCEKIIRWGIKNLDKTFDQRFNRIMCGTYSLLAQTPVSKGIFSLDAAKKNLHWAELTLEVFSRNIRSEKLPYEKYARRLALDKMELAAALNRFAHYKSRTANPPLEKIIEYQIQAREIYSELATILSDPEFFCSAASNLFLLAETNAKLNRLDEVKIFLTECEQKIKTMLILYPSDLGIILNAGRIYSDINRMANDTNDSETADNAADESIGLYRNAMELYSSNSSLTVEFLSNLNNFAERSALKGDGERAAYYKKIAAEIFRRMSKL